MLYNICNTRAHTVAYLKVDAIHWCISMRIHDDLTGAFQNVNHNVKGTCEIMDPHADAQMDCIYFEVCNCMGSGVADIV